MTPGAQKLGNVKDWGGAPGRAGRLLAAMDGCEGGGGGSGGVCGAEQLTAGVISRMQRLSGSPRSRLEALGGDKEAPKEHYQTKSGL